MTQLSHQTPISPATLRLKQRFADEYPFESRWITVGGHNLHYLDEGRGEAVVMVHGNPTWSYFYRKLVLALRSTHRCLVPDHIGCGLSDKPGDAAYSYTLERRVADLEELLEHAAPSGPLTFILHDWGGMIGLAAALRRLERIARIVILNTSGFLKPEAKRMPWQLSLIRNSGPLAPLLVRGLNAFAMSAARTCTVRPLAPNVRAAYIAPYDSWQNRIATLRFVQDIPLSPHDRSYALARWVDENLNRLRGTSMLIGWGLRDFVFDRHFLGEWRRRFPNARVHAHGDAGHYVLEDAGERLIPAICEFARAPVQSRRFSSPAEPTVNIAMRLTQMAQRYPEKRAVVAPRGRGSTGRTQYEHYTFNELERETDRCAHGLVAAGIHRGAKTILFVRPGFEFFALTFALFKIGAIPVLIDPGIGKRQMRRCLAEVDADAFIGVPIAHVFRLWYRRDFRRLCTVITVGRRWFWGGRTLRKLRTTCLQPFETAPTRGHDPAAILFTSGSTGPAKGVVYTHGVFDAQVDYLQSHFGYGPDEIDLPTFPLFALFDAALGMTAVIPDMDLTRPGSVRSERIIDPIREHRCTHMFGSPALLESVSRGAEAAAAAPLLPTLRRVITAGAPIRPSVLEAFHRLLPENTEIFTPYGATEALPVASISSREILAETAAHTNQGAGVCVGRPMRGLDVRIIRICDGPIEHWSDDLALPPREIGEIVVRGPIVTREYYGNPGATLAAKITATDGGTQVMWHRMGDVGYLDESGRLWMCGRKAHRVVTEHGTLFTIPCEAVFNQHAHVRRSALVGIPAARRDPGSPLAAPAPPVQIPVVCVELNDADETKTDLLTQQLLSLAAQYDHTRAIRTVLYHPGFPVDVRHNAKIFREQIAVWAERRIAR